eukprot:s1042_g6.t1
MQCSQFRTDFTPKRGAKGQQATDLTQLPEGNRFDRLTDVITGVQAEVEASPAAGEDEEKIVTIWAGSTGKAPAPSDRKVAPAGTQLQMLRRQRRLMNPLDETLLDTAGLQRRVGQLVESRHGVPRAAAVSQDMAASVSALEIFADRQPVDFGLTAVVELWLGPNQTLPAKSGDDATRYAWTSDPSSPQWLSAVQVSEQDRAEKAVYAWRLKAGH